MNINVLTKLVGVAVSFFIIWIINGFALVDVCLDQGGTFENRTGKCILENGDIYKSGFESPLVVLYVFIGLSVTYFVSKFGNKLFDKKST